MCGRFRRRVDVGVRILDRTCVHVENGGRSASHRFGVQRRKRLLGRWDDRGFSGCLRGSLYRRRASERKLPSSPGKSWASFIPIHSKSANMLSRATGWTSHHLKTSSEFTSEKRCMYFSISSTFDSMVKACCCVARGFISGTTFRIVSVG